MRCHEMVEMNGSSIPFEGIHYPLILGYLTTIPKPDRLLAGNSSFLETAVMNKAGRSCSLAIPGTLSNHLSMNVVKDPFFIEFFWSHPATPTGLLWGRCFGISKMELESDSMFKFSSSPLQGMSLLLQVLFFHVGFHLYKWLKRVGQCSQETTLSSTPVCGQCCQWRNPPKKWLWRMLPPQMAWNKKLAFISGLVERFCAKLPNPSFPPKSWESSFFWLPFFFIGFLSFLRMRLQLCPQGS